VSEAFGQEVVLLRCGRVDGCRCRRINGLRRGGEGGVDKHFFLGLDNNFRVPLAVGVLFVSSHTSSFWLLRHRRNFGRDVVLVVHGVVLDWSLGGLVVVSVVHEEFL
jgi:hypothetical protein